MNKLYGKQKHTIYEIQKELGISKDTLYRYIRKQRNIDNMPVKILLDIAYFEKIEPNKLFREIKLYLGGK